MFRNGHMHRRNPCIVCETPTRRTVNTLDNRFVICSRCETPAPEELLVMACFGATSMRELRAKADILAREKRFAEGMFRPYPFQEPQSDTPDLDAMPPAILEALDVPAVETFTEGQTVMWDGKTGTVVKPYGADRMVVRQEDGKTLRPRVADLVALVTL